MPEPVEVAIVGMAAVFPGAPDLATYWSNILAGVDAITDVPASRWDPCYYDPEAAATRRGDRLYCRRGGFVEAATFDPARFGIMPMAVSGTEPDQLLALHVAAEALADAGGENRLLDRSRVGVIVGRGGYLTPGLARLDQRVRTANQLVTTLRELLPDLDDAELERVRTAFQARLGPERPESAIDLVPNLVASRVANRLDLAGPAYTVDAACASSLVAIDHAVAELIAGRCDVVLAGGVHHCHDITLWSVFSQLGALSPSQQIRPFHRGADGILIGEGTGMVVLKRLADAGDDRVYAVIRGTGMASDGRASSLMSPRADGQVRAIERAWRAAALDPDRTWCARLAGGARYGDSGRRRDGAGLADPGIRAAERRRSRHRHRIGQVDDRSRDAGRGHCWADQSRVGGTPRRAAAHPALRRSAPGAGRLPLRTGHRGPTLAIPRIHTAPGRSQCIRLRRHQRARHPGAATGHPTLAPKRGPPVPNGCCCWPGARQLSWHGSFRWRMPACLTATTRAPHQLVGPAGWRSSRPPRAGWRWPAGSSRRACRGGAATTSGSPPRRCTRDPRRVGWRSSSRDWSKDSSPGWTTSPTTSGLDTAQFSATPPHSAGTVSACSPSAGYSTQRCASSA